MSANYVDQKREDAVELLRTIAALPGGEPPTPPTFHFAHNSSFMTLYGRDRRVRRGQTEVPLEAIANYVAIHDPDFDDLNFAALNRALALELAGLLGVTVSTRTSTPNPNASRGSEGSRKKRHSRPGLQTTTSAPPTHRGGEDLPQLGRVDVPRRNAHRAP